MATPKTKGSPSMIVIAEKLDTLTGKVESIGGTVREIHDKQLTTDLHIKDIIGPPHLEDRLIQYVDRKAERESAALQRDLAQVQTILQLEQQNAALKSDAKLDKVESEVKAVALLAATTESERRINHESNGRRIGKLERNMYIAMGALAALNLLLKFAFSK